MIASKFVWPFLDFMVIFAVSAIFFLYFTLIRWKWHTSKAHALEDAANCNPCYVKVSVEGLAAPPAASTTPSPAASQAGYDLKVYSASAPVVRGETWNVQYDPKKPQESLTTDVYSPGSILFWQIAAGLFTIFGIFVFFWDVHLIDAASAP